MTTELTYDSTKVVPANGRTEVATGLSGAAITAGQAVWLDTSVTPNELKPAKSDSSTGRDQAAAIVGVALNTTNGELQVLSYAASGDILLPPSGGNPLSPGEVYAVSDANAGKLAIASTLASNSFVSLVGQAINDTILRLNLNPVAAKK